MKKRIVTIAGSLGSGKSSTAKAVAQALGYTHFSSGDFFRQAAAERGLTIEEINITSETGNEVDKQVDGILREKAEENNLVIDSRTAFHWIPDSFKVFLFLDPQTAAERIFAQIQKEGRESQFGSSVEEIRENTELRTASEKKRYMNLYGIDGTATNNFDIVLNTKHNDLKTITAMVLAAYNAWSESGN